MVLFSKCIRQPRRPRPRPSRGSSGLRQRSAHLDLVIGHSFGSRVSTFGFPPLAARLTCNRLRREKPARQAPRIACKSLSSQASRYPYPPPHKPAYLAPSIARKSSAIRQYSFRSSSRSARASPFPPSCWPQLCVLGCGGQLTYRPAWIAFPKFVTAEVSGLWV
jgi:hypothetical protein